MARWHLGATSFGACAVVLSVAAFSSRPAAQAVAPTPAPADVMAQLLKEVQTLRSEVRDAAGISIQSQLLVARLQLQEQRILHLDRQRADVRAKLSSAEQAHAPLAAQLKAFTDAPDSAADPDDDGIVNLLKGQVDRYQSAIDALRLEASAVEKGVATEQARWSQFNARLDELEARLSRRP